MEVNYGLGYQNKQIQGEKQPVRGTLGMGR